MGMGRSIQKNALLAHFLDLFCCGKTKFFFRNGGDRPQCSSPNPPLTAPQQNNVTSLPFYLISHSFCLKQALTTLSLRHNWIGAEGAQHLATALQQNNVTSLPFHRISHSFCLTQTLTTLTLSDNRIGDEGAHHLANALQQNNVTSVPFSSNLSFFLFHIDTHHTPTCR